MNQNITTVLLIVLCLYITFKNIKMVKETKKERKYVETYSLVLNEDETALDKINELINENISNAINNKSYVLKTYEELNHNVDPIETVNGIDFNCLFINEKTNTYDYKVANRNNDVFIWLSFVLAKAKKENRNDIIVIIKDKLNTLDSILNTSLEYKLYKGYLAVIEGRIDDDEKFLQDLLAGNYENVTYDKKLIGLYKRMAAAFLDYEHKDLDDYYKEDMKEFGTKLLGRLLLKNLDLLEKYEVKEELEENKEEIKEEDK